MRYQFTRVTNIYGGFLFISRQYPDMDTSLYKSLYRFRNLKLCAL